MDSSLPEATPEADSVGESEFVVKSQATRSMLTPELKGNGLDALSHEILCLAEGE